MAHLDVGRELSTRHLDKDHNTRAFTGGGCGLCPSSWGHPAQCCARKDTTFAFWLSQFVCDAKAGVGRDPCDPRARRTADTWHACRPGASASSHRSSTAHQACAVLDLPARRRPWLPCAQHAKVSSTL